MAPIRFAILTVSDACASGEKTDEVGPLLKALIEGTEAAEYSLNGYVFQTTIVPDDEDSIVSQLIEWSNGQADVILTIGGIGLSKQAVTPEATRKVIHREVPSISIAMLMLGIELTPRAMLSRLVCGVRDKTLIINLPNTRTSATKCLNLIAPVIPQAMDLMLDNKARIADGHESAQHNVMSCSDAVSGTNLTCPENAAALPSESPLPMISVKEASEIMDGEVEKVFPSEIIEIKDARGRIVDVSIYSKVNKPPFSTSMEDGYAVLAIDGEGKRRVLCGVKAGTMPFPFRLESGSCVRVNTGAWIPDGATAVVQIKDTRMVPKKSLSVTEKEEIEVMTQPAEGQDIRLVGSFIKVGQLILASGTSIGPVEIGFLMACECREIMVRKRPSVGVLSTGDVLETDLEILIPERIKESDRITLMLLLQENGYEPVDLGIAINKKTVMLQKIEMAMETVDVLVTTGSMGHKNMLKLVLQKHFKAVIHFDRVNMKPGEPMMFATCTYSDKKKYCLCLPGEPVSEIVTARLFLLPFLNRMQGFSSEPSIVQVKLMSSYDLDPCPEYVSVMLKWDDGEPLPLAHQVENQVSSKLLGCKDGNALLMLPGRTAEKQRLEQGDIVPAMLISLNNSNENIFDVAHANVNVKV